MKCKQIHREIGHLHPELPTDKWPAEIRLHLSACESCRSVYEMVDRSLALIDEERKQAVNPFTYTRIDQAINKPVPRHALHMQKALLRPAFLMFFIFLMISLGLFSGKQIDHALNASNQNISTEEQVQLLAKEYYFQDFDNQLIDTTLSNE